MASRRAVAALTAVFALAVPAAADAAQDGYGAATQVNAPGTLLPAQRSFGGDGTESNVGFTNGEVLPGGFAEPDLCPAQAFGDSPFGATAWYELHPDVQGLVRVTVRGDESGTANPFDAVLVFYPFNRSNGVPNLAANQCIDNQRGTTPEALSFNVGAGQSYKVQVGGYDGGSGPDQNFYEIFFEYFRNTDGDAVFDDQDQCDTVPGDRADGCPSPGPPADSDGDRTPDSLDCKPLDPKVHPGAPEVRGNKVDENCDKELAPFRSIQPAPVLHGIAGSRFTFQDVTVKNVPVGAAVKVTCKHRKRSCGSAYKVRRKHAGSVVLRGLRKTIQPGSKITILVTKRDWIGFFTRYKIRSNKGPKRFDHCVNVGRQKPPPGKCKKTQ